MADNNTTQSAATESAADVKSKKAGTTKTLPTDRIWFEKQIALLRAFAAVYDANGGQPVSNEQAGEVLNPKLSGSTVSQVNGFFSDIGLVTRSDKGGFIPSAEVVDYNTSCQWDENEAKAKLRPIFEKSWFYRCLVPRLQLAPQSQTTCLALLASESKASQEHNEKLLNLIKFLESAGIVANNGGTISLLQNKPTAIVPPVEKSTQPNPAAPAAGIEVPAGSDKHTLYLSSDKKKSVTLIAPLEISNAEYQRICNWIKVALIVGDENSK